MSADPNMPSGENPREEDEGERFGPIRWLYRRYKQYDTWSGRWDWLKWLLEMFRTHTITSVAATGTTAAAVTGTAVVLSDPELRERWLPFIFAEQTAETVETLRWGDVVVYPVTGQDDAGRAADFDVAVLPAGVTWVQESTTVLERDGDRIPVTGTTEAIFTPELRDGLNRSDAVMAVGLASQEGRQDIETERARRRGMTAAGWLEEAVAPETPVWMLNLGQYQSDCPTAREDATGTSWQRPVIFVGIRPEDQEVRLSEAFANAISGKTNLPSQQCYTSFDVTRIR